MAVITGTSAGELVDCKGGVDSFRTSLIGGGHDVLVSIQNIIIKDPTIFNRGGLVAYTNGDDLILAFESNRKVINSNDTITIVNFFTDEYEIDFSGVEDEAIGNTYYTFQGNGVNTIFYRNSGGNTYFYTGNLDDEEYTQVPAYTDLSWTGFDNQPSPYKAYKDKFNNIPASFKRSGYTYRYLWSDNVITGINEFNSRGKLVTKYNFNYNYESNTNTGSYSREYGKTSYTYDTSGNLSYTQDYDYDSTGTLIEYEKYTNILYTVSDSGSSSWDGVTISVETPVETFERGDDVTHYLYETDTDANTITIEDYNTYNTEYIIQAIILDYSVLDSNNTYNGAYNGYLLVTGTSNGETALIYIYDTNSRLVYEESYYSDGSFEKDIFTYVGDTQLVATESNIEYDTDRTTIVSLNERTYSYHNDKLLSVYSEGQNESGSFTSNLTYSDATYTANNSGDYRIVGTSRSDIITGRGYSYDGSAYTDLTTGDTISGSDGNDTIYAYGDNDSIDGGTGTDYINGGTGADTVTGGTGNDSVYGNDGNDSMTGASGNDTIYGEAGNDSLTGGDGNDIVNGGAGDDILTGGNGTDTLIGGDGNDTYVVDSTTDIITDTSSGNLIQSSITFNLSSSKVTGVDDLTLIGSGNINGVGTTGDNDITGNSYNNILDGKGGVDSILGGAGNDTIYGYGNDTLDGGTGSDTYIFTSITSIISATDTINDTGNTGTDLIKSSVSFDLSTTTGIENLTLTGTDNINGTGNNSNNVITGNSGNNILKTLGGTDTLDGGAGNDTLYGYDVDNPLATASSLLKGGTGNDSFRVYGTSNTINDTSGIDTIISSANLSLTSSKVRGVENLILEESATAAIGNGSNNIITGNTSLASTLSGLSGNDSLVGGTGNDTLDGGTDNDTLYGSTGNDSLVGGVGNDTYIINSGDGNDTITDLSGTNVIRYGSGIALDDIYVSGTGTALGSGELTGLIMNATSSNNFNIEIGSQNITVNSRFNRTLNLQLEDGTVVNMNRYTRLYNIDGETSDTAYDFSTIPLYFASNEMIYGDVGNETISGGKGDDFINGGDGNDSVNGGIGNDILIGGAGSNRLEGEAGNDILYGNGNDTLHGGIGNDIYVINNTTDTIEDSAGIDTIKSSVSYTSLGPSIEKLTLIGYGDIDGTGNALANVITGNSGDNVLSSVVNTNIKTGDTLIGGTGDDTYVISSLKDIVSEAANQGTDLIETSLSYTLGSNIENLTLTGSSAVNCTGNSLNNTITGNTGDNILNGKTGADSLVGGAGNDTYVFNRGDGFDSVTDTAGTDIIKLGSLVSKSKVAIYEDSGTLYIDYGTVKGHDVITVQDQSANTVERIQLSNGQYLTNTEINTLIQSMVSYASSHSISLTSVANVRDNAGLMTLVTSAWHS